ncbi:MAG: transporter substrate-binding domain-containing protein [Planctomycetota bacterium]|nr:transporter substrate-binding domain-containing protein [Planctomycetota bacterium]
MNAIRSGRCLAAAFMIVGLIIGCAAEPTADEPAMEAASQPALPTLNVGTSRTVPPIIFEEDGQTVGLEADLARELAAALGMKARLVPMYWPNLIPELRAGRIDIIMAGMSITDERKREVAFAEPYLTTGQAALIRAADRPSLGTARQVLGTRRPIGVEVASTGEGFVSEQMPRATRRSFPIVSKAVDALVLDDVDVVIHDRPTILWLAREHADDDLFVVPGRFTEESLAWAVQRDETALRQRINDVLEKWKRTGRLEEIIARWIPGSE